VLLPLAWTVFRRNKREVLPMVFAGALFAMAALPWLLYAQPWHQKGALGPEHHLAKILLYFREFHFHFLPWIFVLLPIGAGASPRWKSRRKDSNQAVETTAASQQKQSPAETAQAFTGVLRQFEWHLILLIPIFMVVISVAPGRFTRYQLPLAPIACVLMAAWTIRHVRWPAAAIGLLVVACTSSFLAFVSGYPFRGEEHTLRWTLPRFSVGITKPYTDRFADVVAFFNQEAKPGDEAFVFDPEFPLIFYTRLRIVDGRLLAGLPDRMPEWMLPESPSGVAEQVPGPLPDLLRPYYDAVRIPVHNSTRRGSIPDPDNYEYRTPETMSTFGVFRKKRQEPGQ
jgi:hypothetical protein